MAVYREERSGEEREERKGKEKDSHLRLHLSVRDILR
jgi:hypothetical protein